MGLKVANVPLVLEVPPPKELITSTSLDGQNNNDIDNSSTIYPNRVFCLTIAPSELKRIRTTRLERSQVSSLEEKKYGFDSNSLGSRTNSNPGTRRSIESFRKDGDVPKSKYNDRAYLMNDLRNARDLAMKHNWTQIDVTGRAVEETATLISELMNERFENDIFNI